jgi:hypothetical protein
VIACFDSGDSVAKMNAAFCRLELEQQTQIRGGAANASRQTMAGYSWADRLVR